MTPRGRTDPEIPRPASNSGPSGSPGQNPSAASRGCDRPEPDGDPASGLRQAHRPPLRFSLSDSSFNGPPEDSESACSNFVGVEPLDRALVARLQRSEPA